MNNLGLTFLLILLPISITFAHGNEDHSKAKESDAKSEELKESHTKGSQFEKEKIEKIAKAYTEKVEPIFEAKCYDCHSSNRTDYPWYHSIPGIKQLINADIEEGKSHIILSDGFPFKGHGKVIGDLKSLKKSVEEDSMPIFEYKLMHWDSSLTEAEKKKTLDWIQKSLQLLESD